jgi:hypothetical protein
MHSKIIIKIKQITIMDPILNTGKLKLEEAKKLKCRLKQ